MEDFMEETCGETTAEMGRQHNRLLVAAEYKRMAETSWGQGYREESWGQGYPEANC
jgi:hypothetical protein